MVSEALALCKRCGYGAVFLWTVIALTTATRVYRSFGVAAAAGPVQDSE
jgi:hypothetical protein